VKDTSGREPSRTLWLLAEMGGVRRGFRRGSGIEGVCSQALDFSITQSMSLDSESCGGVARVDYLVAI